MFFPGGGGISLREKMMVVKLITGSQVDHLLCNLWAERSIGNNICYIYGTDSNIAW